MPNNSAITVRVILQLRSSATNATKATKGQAYPFALSCRIREMEDNLSRFAEQHGRHGEATDVAPAYLDVLTATDDQALTNALKRLFPAYFRDYWDAASHARFFKLRSDITAWAEPSNRGGIARTDFRDQLIRVRTPALVICGACRSSSALPADAGRVDRRSPHGPGIRPDQPTGGGLRAGSSGPPRC
jgi:hypothetical protein